MTKGIVWVAEFSVKSPANPNVMVQIKLQFDDERSLEAALGLKRRQPTHMVRGKCKYIERVLTVRKGRYTKHLMEKQMMGTMFYAKRHKTDTSPQAAMFQHAKQHEYKEPFFVCRKLTGNRCYGAFPCFDHFWREYQRLDDKCCVEELIPGDTPRKCVFDIEWLTDQPFQEDIETKRKLVVACIEKCLGVKTDLMWLVGSRQKGSAYKNSYHLILPSIVFENLEAHQRFNIVLYDELDKHPELWITHTDEHGQVQRTCIVDRAIYTRNRAFRMVFSAKEPGQEPLRPEDPGQDPRLSVLTAFFPTQSLFDVARFPPAKRASTAAKRTGTGARGSKQPVPKQGAQLTRRERTVILQVLHAECGHTDVEVFDDITSLGNDVLFLRLGLTETACCLHNRVHESDHMFLTFNRRSGLLTYRCFRSTEHEHGVEQQLTFSLWSELHATTVDFDEEYKEPAMRPYSFPDGIDTLAVEAQMGVGKTKQMNKFIGQLPRSASILIITHRISLARKDARLLGPLGFAYYKDIKTPEERARCHRVVSCVDSVWRFVNERPWDYVLIDEVDSLLGHLSSGSIAKRDWAIGAFGRVMRSARKVIVMDAFISYRVVATLEMLRKGGRDCISLVRNTFVRPTKKIATFIPWSSRSQDVFETLMRQKLDAGKRIAVCSMSCSYTNDLYARFQETHGDTKQIMVVNSGNPLPEDTAVCEEQDMLIYSPSISSGISFETLHYHVLFVHMSIDADVPDVWDLLQMIHRIRQLIDNDLFLMYAPTKNKKTMAQAVQAVLPTNELEVVRALQAKATDVCMLMGTSPPQNELGFYDLTEWRVKLFALNTLRKMESLRCFDTVLRAALTRDKIRIFYFDETPVVDEIQQHEQAEEELNDETQEQYRRELAEILGCEVEPLRPVVFKPGTYKRQLWALTFWNQYLNTRNGEARDKLVEQFGTGNFQAKLYELDHNDGGIASVFGLAQHIDANPDVVMKRCVKLLHIAFRGQMTWDTSKIRKTELRAAYPAVREFIAQQDKTFRSFFHALSGPKEANEVEKCLTPRKLWEVIKKAGKIVLIPMSAGNNPFYQIDLSLVKAFRPARITSRNDGSLREQVFELLRRD